MRIAPIVLLALAAFACGSGESTNPYKTSAKPAPAGPPPKIEGVHPDAFDCKAVLPEAEGAGATHAAVKWAPADMPGTPGTPSPCVYVAEVQPDPPDAGPRRAGVDAAPGPSRGILAWQFHLDCRPVAVADAQAIIAQAKTQDGSKELQLGRGAVDHSGARVIAVDADTDCAAYVVGPDEATRTALAGLVLGKLDKSNMPRSPRAVR
jgi:hypothetical protein